LASIAGIGGTVVRPAPSLAPRKRVELVPTRRVSFDPAAAARAEPSGAEASRFDARDTVDGELIGSGASAGAGTSGAPATADGLIAPAGAGDPHTSQ
jgi:hypothetical protein